MEIQQMWASPHLGKKGHYARFLLGSMGGILLVGLFLSVGGAILLMPLGTKKALPSLFLCLGTALLMGVLALAAGRKSAMECTFFFQTTQGELYAFDARSFPSGKVLLFFQGIWETQRTLSSLAISPRIPPGARKITRVEAIVPHRTYFLLRLQDHGPVYLLSRRLEGVDSLVSLLRQKTGPSWGKNTREKKGLWGILGCGTALLLFCLLAYLCHPAVGALPLFLYAPCVLLAFGAFSLLVYFFVLHHRGL